MIPNEYMARAAEQAAIMLNESLPRPEDCTHLFSQQFRRKMNRIFRREKHPVLYRCLKSAAVILLVITVCFGSVLALSAEAREFVFGWVRERCGDFYHFYFTGENKIEGTAQYCPGWLPDGYVLDRFTEFPEGGSYCYHDQNGWIATFVYSTRADELELYIQCANFEQKEVTVNGLPGTVYLAPDDADSSEIVWVDDLNGVIFNLGAHVSEDVLVKMAENIVIKK